MIGFNLTEEQRALQEMAREFAAKEMSPSAAKYDEGEEFPEDVMKKSFEVGFLTCTIPKEYGGGGLNDLDTVIISEELAAGCAGMYTTIMVNALAYTPIMFFGTDEQKKKFLTPQTDKMSFAAFCLTEREAGSDAGSIKTKAEKVGDKYIINGSKCFISNGGIASLYVVFALTDPEKGARGMSAFIVTRDTPGLTIGKVEDKMGHRASNTVELFFDDLKISFKIAEMATEINAARHLVWHAAWLMDEGKPHSKEAAMAKCFGSDIAMKVTTEALQLFGGYGYMKDYPMEKLMRDAKLLQIYEGTNEIQQLIISREVIGPIKK